MLLNYIFRNKSNIWTLDPTAQAWWVQIGLHFDETFSTAHNFSSNKMKEIVIYNIKLHEHCMLWVGVYLVVDPQ